MLKAQSPEEITNNIKSEYVKNLARTNKVNSYLGSNRINTAFNLGFNIQEKTIDKIPNKDFGYLKTSETEPKKYLKNSSHTFNNKVGFYI
jgi:hypothetical protein